MAKGKLVKLVKSKSIGEDFKSPVSPQEPKVPPPPPAPEGVSGSDTIMEIVFSFDTTGSMYSVLDEVRKNLSDMIERLTDDIPSIRIGVIAHGDYSDEKISYVIKMVDFTRDKEQLIRFVNNVGRTSGGDADECYELALKTARTQFSWSPLSHRALVVLGDANPHQCSYWFYKDHYPINWNDECDKLKDMGVHIYGVQCNSGSLIEFYQSMAKKTDGIYLRLGEFKNILDMILAICYKEHGAEAFFAYEKEVRDREMRMKRAMDKDLDAMLVTLRKSASNASTMSLKDSDPPTPITSGRPPLKRLAPTAIVSPTPAKKVKFEKKKAKAPKKTIAAAKKDGSCCHKTAKKDGSCRHKTATKDGSCRHKTATKDGSCRHKTATVKTLSRKSPKPNENLREKAKDNNISKRKWTNWELLLTHKAHADCKYKRPRSSLHPGFRNITALKSTLSKGAVYELAVSLPNSSVKHTVYVRSGGRLYGKNLDTFMLLYTHVKDQVDELIKKNCKIYVRATLLKHYSEEASRLRAKYDYAWVKGAYGRRRHRQLTKGGIIISNPNL